MGQRDSGTVKNIAHAMGLWESERTAYSPGQWDSRTVKQQLIL